MTPSLDLVHRIHADFRYKSGATTVTTTLPEVLERRAGVCQDFAHLAVGCLRSVGLAARYVSGYLETAPPPGRPKLVGADASHAWVSVLVPGAGWVALDPTNDQLVDERYRHDGLGARLRRRTAAQGRDLHREHDARARGAGRRDPGRAGRRGPRGPRALTPDASWSAAPPTVRQAGGVRAFACDVCSQLVFFENSVCVSCGSALGFSREQARVVALDPRDRDVPDAGRSRPARLRQPRPRRVHVARRRQVRPRRAVRLLRADPHPARRRRPDGLEAFARTEAAKRRLVFQLDALGLPVVGRDVDPEHGLAFDLLSSARRAGGHRSRRRAHHARPGRGRRRLPRVAARAARRAVPHLARPPPARGRALLLGRAGRPRRAPIEAFRELFGDERADYAAGPAGALRQRAAAAAGTPSYVSSYATAHPWEDWAETFAHYLHIRDTLQTASAYGLWVGGPDAPVRPDPAVPLAALPTETGRRPSRTSSRCGCR